MALTIGITALVASFGTIDAILALTHTSPSEMVRFLGVKHMIEARYVGDVDDDKLMDGAISGMVQSLGDPHSVYMNAETFKSLQQQTSGSFGGIGVTMGFKDNKVTVISVLPDTPGEKAGIKAGDEIVAVDGTPVTDYQPEEVALHIRGDVGTKVTLTIHREGEEDKDYELTRDNIKVKTAQGKMLDGNIGYIRIASFSENTGDEFKDAYDELEQEGMKGLIIDLRENPGGLLTSCVEIAKMVVPKGPIVSVVQRNGSKEEYDSDLEESKYPIVVLIDGNSASASEILSGALQDTGAATIVGTTSYGKGSVQSVVPLFHDDGLKLTIAKYYTPNGRNIDGTGIQPDVEIDFKDTDTTDIQLQKAEEVMQQKLSAQ